DPTSRRQAEGGNAATSGDAPDAISKGQSEPQVAIGPGGDARWSATGRGDVELGEAATGGDAPDGIPTQRGEPEIAIRSGRDELRPAQGRWDGEASAFAIGGDASNGGTSGEPQVAIRPSRDADRRATARGERELGNRAHIGPGGSSAQAQQTDAGNYGGEKCGQVRPPSRTIHVSSSFVWLCMVLHMGVT
ncbi:MAG TPA: hypothetical protein VN954_10960, partial [Ktedonobacteraceae bacterium]|nr:hypothetical protein [Ktedonobacteraceae bacterium]